MRIGISVLLFFVSFLGFHLIGSSVFPVSEDNYLMAPAWYPFALLGFSVFIPYIYMKLSDPNSNRIKWFFSNPEKRYIMAVEITLSYGYASESYLQRKLGISFPVAHDLTERIISEGIAKRYIPSQEVKQSQNNHEQKIQSELYDCSESNYLKSSGTDTELLKVDSMDGHAFEHWCASILLKNGFSSAEVTPGSGDHGVDVVAVKDEVRYAVQCKCYHSDLGNTPVQEVYAGKEMYGCQVGVVMTNRYFTKGAKELAQKTRVLLWDRERLAALIESAEKNI